MLIYIAICAGFYMLLKSVLFSLSTLWLNNQLSLREHLQHKLSRGRGPLLIKELVGAVNKVNYNQVKLQADNPKAFVFPSPHLYQPVFIGRSANNNNGLNGLMFGGRIMA